MEYPDIDDPNFQVKIAERMEFRELSNVDRLYPHQEFVRRFMSPYTPYKSLIMYHSLGSGKSIACIAVAVDHYLYDGKRCTIVTKGNSGTSNFVSQIEMYRKDMSESGKQGKWDKSLFDMRHYISMSNKVNNVMSDNDVKNKYSNRILILDEVHNVKYFKKDEERSVYGSIMKILRLCKNVKIIIATATPMTDNDEQINSLLRICNHSRSGSDKKLMNGIISYNSVVQDKPESEEIGYEGYVPGMRVYAPYMGEYQKKAYSIYSKQNPNASPKDIYRKPTHISLFCFEDGTYGRDIQEPIDTGKKKMTLANIDTIIMSMSTKQTKHIKCIKYIIKPEFALSLKGDSLINSSSKYSAVVDLLERTIGNVFVFLEEVKGSGLLLLASVLEQHGYELYLGDYIKNMRPGKRYTMCVGSIDICPNNTDRLDGFNCDENMNGEYVRVLLGSRVIGESITLKNVRHFCCLTPHWNDSTVDQAIGRVIRNGSHASLDPCNRHVNVYIHASIFPDDPENSVDIKKLLRCKEKEEKIQIVSQKMIECAVDRFCTNDESPVPVTYVDTFAAAYMHHYEKHIVKKIRNAFARSFTYTTLGSSEARMCSTHVSIHPGIISIYDLSEAIGVHPTICEEALCRMIFSNTFINKSGGFLRANGNTVFLVDDPSLPYVMIPAPLCNPVTRPEKAHNVSDLVQRAESQGCIGAFRRMPVRDKAVFLEWCIENRRRNFLNQIFMSYAVIDNTVYHLLLYRELDSSYTSSNPVPKSPQGRTRAFDKGAWKTVKNRQEEHYIFERYREIVSSAVDLADKQFGLYGVVSTIDGNMRLRLRGTENYRMSSVDKRYVKRGKNMRSIKKEQLLEILSYISNDTVDRTMSINEIVERIDRILVGTNKYLVL